MLKSADLHETILTPVICHKHVRYHDGVTLYFSMKFPSVAPKKTRNGNLSIHQQISALSKLKQSKKERRKPLLNACSHWESESRNRSFSAAVLHVKPSLSSSVFLYQDMEGNIKWLDSTAAVISLLIISYANFLTVFWQFSDDSKYLSSCHKEMITARICCL